MGRLPTFASVPHANRKRLPTSRGAAFSHWLSLGSFFRPIQVGGKLFEEPQAVTIVRS